MKMADYLWLIPGVVFHPIETCLRIKEKRDTLSLIPAGILLLLYTAASLGMVYLVHFPLATVDPRTSNAFLQIGIYVVPIISWTASAYGVTSIMDGEVKAKELITAVAYGLIPYTIITILATAGSYLISATQTGLYGAIQTIAVTWLVLFQAMAIYVLNGYTFWKTLRTIFLIIVGMALIVFIAFLLYSMSAQLFAFLGGFLREMTL